LSAFKELVSLVEEKKLLAASKPLKESGRISGEVLWQKWIDDETRKRTGYCVWVSSPGRNSFGILLIIT
jgi:hypothetical protein